MPPPKKHGLAEFSTSRGFWSNFGGWSPPHWHTTPRLWTGNGGHKRCFADLQRWKNSGASLGRTVERREVHQDPTTGDSQPIFRCLAAGRNGTSLAWQDTRSRQEGAVDASRPFVSLESARTFAQARRSMSGSPSLNHSSCSAPAFCTIDSTPPPRSKEDFLLNPAPPESPPPLLDSVRTARVTSRSLNGDLKLQAPPSDPWHVQKVSARSEPRPSTACLSPKSAMKQSASEPTLRRVQSESIHDLVGFRAVS